jgi:hypothetical protein
MSSPGFSCRRCAGAAGGSRVGRQLLRQETPATIPDSSRIRDCRHRGFAVAGVRGGAKSTCRAPSTAAEDTGNNPGFFKNPGLSSPGFSRRRFAGWRETHVQGAIHCGGRHRQQSRILQESGIVVTGEYPAAGLRGGGRLAGRATTITAGDTGNIPGFFKNPGLSSPRFSRRKFAGWREVHVPSDNHCSRRHRQHSRILQESGNVVTGVFLPQVCGGSGRLAGRATTITAEDTGNNPGFFKNPGLSSALDLAAVL